VLFALVLFLTAMSQRDVKTWIGRALLSLALVVDVVGLVILATFPIRI
jgi:Kef-type K+ transport system membrane component KefB